MFSPFAISWFPNHFVSLDLHSRHALTAYDAVAVLGPSDTTRVKEQLPHKHVVHIPHVIDDPGGLGETSCSALRKKYGVPEGKFVALVNFAGYPYPYPYPPLPLPRPLPYPYPGRQCWWR
jgi:hypothetical protein